MTWPLIFVALALALALCLLGEIAGRTLPAPLFVPLRRESIDAFRKKKGEAE